MSSFFDRLSISAGADLPRRAALKAMVATLGGAAVGFVGPPSQMRAQTGGTAVTRALSLGLRINNPPRGVDPATGPPIASVTLVDRMAGRIQIDGAEPRTLLAHILESSNAVELSVLEQGNLEQRLTLVVPAVEPRTLDDVSWVEVASLALPGVSVAAFGLKDAELPIDYNAETDCCTTCCWGGMICGCAACCNPGDPGCGNCCDSGCCPGCLS